jgi:hypothetical protein
MDSPIESYFGHPPAGFFFASDFFIASSQLPSIFRVSAAGPGLDFGAVLAFVILFGMKIS